MIQKNSKITIGLPVYNREKVIQKRLDNILSQSFQNFEIIIYDNSNDSTSRICKKYDEKEKRILYVYEETRKGVENAFNYVLKKADTNILFGLLLMIYGLQIF